MRPLLPLLPVLGLLWWGCRPAPTLREADLTNNGRGKYWDAVYSTSIYGRINESYAAESFPTRHKQLRVPYRCDYFAANGRVVHYDNVDSVTVWDLSGTSCLVYNPDRFRLRDSTLTFWGKSFKVLALTPKLMVLEYEFEHQKALSIYVPSRYQHKRVRQVKERSVN